MAGCKNELPKEYILDEADLVPEGIAWSQKTNAFYLTSVSKSKIIKVDAGTGETSDFISEREYGYLPGVGIYADDNRDLLYAICGGYEWPDSLTSLFVFQLSTGEFVKRYSVPDSGHFLNDMAIAKSGAIYLTDTKGASVYRLPNNGEALELFFHSDEISYPQWNCDL